MPLNDTLAQSDRVALASLRKFYDPLGNQQGRRVLAIQKPQLTQGLLEGAHQHFDLLWSEGGLLHQNLLDRHGYGTQPYFTLRHRRDGGNIILLP
jgi:hypothetical protein